MLCLDDAKRALRVTSDLMDNEVLGLLAAAREDMVRAGLPEEFVDGESALVAHACALFCKAHFGYDNSEAARFEASYRETVCDLLNSACGEGRP